MSRPGISLAAAGSCRPPLDGTTPSSARGGQVVDHVDGAEEAEADLRAVKEVVTNYGYAVQEADVERLRTITFGAIREQYSLANTELIGAQLVSDAFQYGSVTMSDFRDASFASDWCKIVATVSFERAAPLHVQFSLVKRAGTWMVAAARTLPGEATDWRTTVAG